MTARKEQHFTWPLGFHPGNNLASQADRYPTLSEKLIESIQNGLDAKASIIMIAVNLRQRYYTVRDNGHGAEPERIMEALGNIHQSLKGPKDAGKYGIGLWAPMTIGSHYTFTTRPDKAPQSYFTCDFKRQEIARMTKENMAMPARTRLDIRRTNYTPSLKNATDYQPLRPGVDHQVWWSTEVAVTGLDTDPGRVEIDLADFEYEIKHRFGRKMLKTKTTIIFRYISIEGECDKVIVGSDIEGVALPTQMYDNPAAGRVYVDLRLPSEVTRVANRINIWFGAGEPGDCDHLVWGDFHLSGGTKHLSEETLEILRSGEVAGFINSSGLIMTPDRKRLVNNSALRGVCECLEKYVKEVVAPHLKDVKNTKKKKLHTDAASAAFQELSELFDSSSVAPVIARLQKMGNIGSIGKGHTPVDAKVVGAEKGVAIKAKPLKGGGGGNAGGGSGGKDRPRHTPKVVVADDAPDRVLVKTDSIGLGITHASNVGSSKLWEFDPNRCLITVNKNNSQFGICEGRGLKVLSALHRRIIIGVLSMVSVSRDSHLTQPMAEEFVRLSVAELINDTEPKKRPFK
jgi:hypothetical protein